MKRPIKLGSHIYDASLSFDEFKKQYGSEIRKEYSDPYKYDCHSQDQAIEYRYDFIHMYDLFQNGTLKIDSYTGNERLLNSSDVRALDSFSFWAWRKICLWKDKDSGTVLKIFKRAVASGAFVGIIGASSSEVIIRSIGRVILKPISTLAGCEINGADSKGADLSALALLEASTGFFSNFLPQKLEEKSRIEIASDFSKFIRIVNHEY